MTTHEMFGTCPTKNIGGFNVINFCVCDDEHRLVVEKEFQVEGTKSTINIRGQSDPDTPEMITELYNSINTFRDLKNFLKTQPFVRSWYM